MMPLVSLILWVYRCHKLILTAKLGLLRLYHTGKQYAKFSTFPRNRLALGYNVAGVSVAFRDKPLHGEGSGAAGPGAGLGLE
jgi:hypothetical protein